MDTHRRGTCPKRARTHLALEGRSPGSAHSAGRRRYLRERDAGGSRYTRGPNFKEAAAFDVSKPLRDLVKNQKPSHKGLSNPTGKDTDSELSAEPAAGSARIASGASIDSAAAQQAANSQELASAIPGTIANFEGISNQDNFNIFGFRVNPPDPVGDVGPNHYVEMVNLAVGIYSKSGTLLLGPVDIGALWAGFAVEDCTDPSGDPVVVYDQLADRWILTQFTTRGLDPPFTILLQLCRRVDDRRSDGLLLPLRLPDPA